MKISKIFAGMSALAIAATTVMAVSAVEPAKKHYTFTVKISEMIEKGALAEPTATDGVYNIGFNIQFGHYDNGQWKATVKGAKLFEAVPNADATNFDVGDATTECAMAIAKDWKNTPETVIALADDWKPTVSAWNGAWVQFFCEDYSDVECTFELDLTDALFEDMDPEDEDFAGWTILRTGDTTDASPYNFIQKDPNETDEGEAPAEETPAPAETPAETPAPAATAPAATAPATGNTTTGASAGLALAGLALAGAAVVVSKKR